MLCHLFWSQVEYKIVCFIYYYYNYDALNNHINGSKIVEVCDGKLRIGSLETGLLTLE